MKIRDLITQDKATLSFEVFPPKKDTDFADVEAAALGIAAFKPDYMSVTYGAGGSTKGHTLQLAQEILEKDHKKTVLTIQLFQISQLTVHAPHTGEISI